MSDDRPPVLEVENLSIGFDNDDGLVTVVENVTFTVERGKSLALVGESGCGKSLTALALLQLLPPFGKILEGSVRLHGRELVGLSDNQMQKIRGGDISMIFQEPMSALNPVFSIGKQIAEALVLHQRIDGKEAYAQAIGMLEAVGIPDAPSRADSYPHQLSGGMRQRVMIAMALACEPDVLIADEPTTALDVTIQAQILDLIHDLQEKFHTAILFISHDFGVVSRMADDIAVMYAGRIIEHGTATDVLLESRHPYTGALLSTTPRIDVTVDRLPAIPGRVPQPTDRSAGCYFTPRCPKAMDVCGIEQPQDTHLGDRHYAACHELTHG